MRQTDGIDDVPAYPFGEPVGLELDERYLELRRRAPVARVRLPYGGEAWFVTRYADVKRVLNDPCVSMGAAAGRDLPRYTERPLQPGKVVTGLPSMDPPEHTRVRKLAAKAFTGRRVDILRPRVVALVDGLLDDLAGREPPGDLMSTLALPLPMTVICELLGVPVADRDMFRTLSEALLGGVRSAAEEMQRAEDDFRAYMAGLVAQRRREPTDDLLGAMVQARDEEDRLSDAELIMLATAILVAGHETTANQIGNFTFHLLRDRSRYEALCADPDLVPNAIEELLRITPLSTVAGFVRVAKEDITIGDTKIPAGDALITSIATANRDDEVFENPNDIDLTRSYNPHLSFGHGIHYCLGAQLARLELNVAITGLVRRFPNLRLARPEWAVPWRRNLLVRGPEELLVSW
jgi:cytochrome P450